MVAVLLLAFGFVVTIAAAIIWSVVRGLSRSWTGRRVQPGIRRSRGVGGGRGAAACPWFRLGSRGGR